MTVAPAPPAPTTAPAADGGDGDRPGFWRRNRVWVAVAAALVVAVAVAVWTSGGDRQYDAALDPQNPGPDGAQAVARVLGDEGVDVTIARSADELAAADVDEQTTVVVTSTGQLAPSTTERLLSDVSGGALVLVDPPYHVLEELPDRPVETRADDETTADCGDDRFDGLRIVVDSATGYRTEDGCFSEGGWHVLATGGDGRTYFGAGQALTNDQVLRGDNAAVALRLLGQDQRLVWYVPTFEDAEEGEAVSIWTFAPDWLGPALWCVALAAVALVWWRARRLGPLATEPLPVVVRAVETARSRGRMYRRSNDRGHAAAALRAAARRRLADRLQLGRRADEAAVVSAVAHHLGRPEAEIAALLTSTAPVPGSDHALVRLGQELTQLDREVRRG